MTLELKFKIGQKVVIKEIDQKATVRAIQLDTQGTTFQVSYFCDCKIQNVWLFPDELDAL